MTKRSQPFGGFPPEICKKKKEEIQPITKILETSCQKVLAGHKSRVICLAITSDSKYLVSGSSNCTMRS